MSAVLGWIEVLIATLFFGSNFVPVKRYEAYDGMYYQWIMCAAIFMVGLFLQLFLFAVPPDDDHNGVSDHEGAVGNTSWMSDDQRLLLGRPDPYSVKFIPFAAFGGALWATGNTLSVPAINCIGLSMGLLIWGSANMLMGWATGRFGLFGLPADSLQKPALNSVGVALAVIALCMYAFIKPSDASKSSKVASSETRVDQMSDILLDTQPMEPSDAPKSGSKQVVGVAMAITAGLMFGNTFTPPNIIMKTVGKGYEHDKTGCTDPHVTCNGPQNPIDYVFSHFCGIFAASTFWFIVYCCVMRGSPMINPRLTLPAFISGLMWAVAQTSWFLANTALGGVSVAFPIITSGPGIISALWGVFVFKEIQGRRNYVVLCTAIVTAVVGCVLIALSK